MRLVIDEAAWRDLEKIGVWIAREGSVEAARRVLADIQRVIELIPVFPRLARAGKARGTFERVVAHTSYIIVYELWDEPEAIVITGVVHGARDR